MYPVIHIFGLNIYPYGLMIGIGLIAAILLFTHRCKNRGIDEDSAFNAAIFIGISGILGAKILYIVVEFPELIKHPSMIIKDFSNGFVLYGGVIFGVLVGYLYTRYKKWPFLKVFDIAAPSIPLAQAFGRVGCFFAGCCYGKETDSFIGVMFNNSPYAPKGVHLIPTQVISSFGDFIIFLMLMWYDKNKKAKNGQTGALYLLLYSVFRFIIEFFRDDPRGTVFNVLSTSQFICILVFIAGIIFMVKAKPSDEDKDAVLEAAVGKENKAEFNDVQPFGLDKEAETQECVEDNSAVNDENKGDSTRENMNSSEGSSE